jgi:uncharacterized integral membrane protein (TIGR00698 family)
MLHKERHTRQSGTAFAGFMALSASCLPGVALTSAIAVLAQLIQRQSGLAALSPLIVAMVLGMALRNVWPPGPRFAPGIKFSVRTILRLAIVLLGFQLTLLQIASVGLRGFAVIVGVLVATFLFMVVAGRLLGVDRKLAELLAAGTSVCGASAVVATNSVTGGTDEDVAYAIACVTVFGSLSLLLFPIMGGALALAPVPYGIWVGASIHEVAQATGAAFQGGAEAGQIGTVAKLTRVLMLAPLVLALGLCARRRNADAANPAAPFPLFVLGFMAVVLINSAWPLPSQIGQPMGIITSFLLSIALAAMGLETDIRKLRAKGLRPLTLGALGWLFISALGLLLVLAL